MQLIAIHRDLPLALRAVGLGVTAASRRHQLRTCDGIAELLREGNP